MSAPRETKSIAPLAHVLLLVPLAVLVAARRIGAGLEPNSWVALCMVLYVAVRSLWATTDLVSQLHDPSRRGTFARSVVGELANAAIFLVAALMLAQRGSHVTTLLTGAGVLVATGVLSIVMARVQRGQAGT